MILFYSLLKSALKYILLIIMDLIDKYYISTTNLKGNFWRRITPPNSLVKHLSQHMWGKCGENPGK